MSATADIAKYREYFRDLGRGERVEVLAIPTTSKDTIFQRKVLYLEQVPYIVLTFLMCHDLGSAKTSMQSGCFGTLIVCVLIASKASNI